MDTAPTVTNFIELEPDAATRAKRDEVCSDCYGELIVRYDPKSRKSRVTCSTPGCTFHGRVSRKYVERARAENAQLAITAAATLAGKLSWLPKRSEQELLKGLGG